MLRALSIVLVLVVAGCETTEEHLALARVEHTPLELDPTEDVKIGRWWSNGQEMLRLDPVGSFALYANPNRYHTPIKTGSWSKQSYFELLLEPYEMLGPTPIRVSITKSDGRIGLVLPDVAAMFAIDAPPAVVEDGLVGSWSGRSGEITMRDDQRYAFSPQVASGAIAFVAGHEGTWRVEDRRLILEPDPPKMRPIFLELRDDDETMVLVAPDSEFRRAAPATIGGTE